MSPTLVRLTVAAFALAAVASAQAQPISAVTPSASVPRVVRLDGQFVPLNGLPPAAVESVTLSIYASQTDETPLWSETQDVRVDAQGRYAVLLGGSTAEGIPASALSGEARWLGIRFARPGEVEQPRVPMTSVPYALRASDADTLGGLPPSAFLKAPGATASSGDAGTTAGTAATRATTPLTAGTIGRIGKFTTSVDLGDSVMTESGGRIGVNTTTPLDVVHSRFTDATGGITGLAVQNLSGGANAYSGMLFYDQNGALGQFQGFNNSTKEYRINNIGSGGTINFMIGGTSRFLVRNDGDVEMGGQFRRPGGQPWAHVKGVSNAGLGVNALGAITGSGSEHVAVGIFAMQNQTGGFANVGVGPYALLASQTTQQNTVIGYRAMEAATGSFTVALGAYTARNKVTGNSNIYIGNDVANDVNNTESFTVRIADTINYSRFFVGAVRGVTTGQSDAVAVVIDSNGQLGTVNSSRRYKEDIQDMGDASSALMKLRPVTYRYTQAFADGRKPIDYGLIAEEVEQVYPDLVAHLKDGEVETVQYHKINAMLLNEVQKQHRQIGDQQRELTDLKARLAALERLLATGKK
jgi:Chaperone of endosialidase